MATQKTDCTIYIGRFAPFHYGHAHVLERALQTSKLVIVLVGSGGQARSIKNPFTFAERYDMIADFADSFAVENGFRHQGAKENTNAALVVVPLKDHPYNNALWIKSVQEIVQREIARFAELRGERELTSISLTGSDRDSSTWYLSAFPQWHLNLVSAYTRPPDTNVSATSVREILFGDFVNDVADAARLLAKVPQTTANFLVKFMRTKECELLRQEHAHIRAYKSAWSTAPYAPTFVTTDAVVVQSGHVLVVERGAFPGKGLWALPGGFLNQNEYLQDGVIRELMEETGIRLAEGKKAKDLTISILKGSIKNKEIFDKPDRSLRGRTITTAFLFRLDDTKPLPNVKGQNMPLHESGGKEIVETAKAFWLPISEALMHSERFFEDHHGILETMISGRD